VARYYYLRFAGFLHRANLAASPKATRLCGLRGVLLLLRVLYVRLGGRDALGGSLENRLDVD
jgi:hypothetical protein